MMPLQIKFEIRSLLYRRDSFFCYKRDKWIFNFFGETAETQAPLHEFLELLNNYRGADNLAVVI